MKKRIAQGLAIFIPVILIIEIVWLRFLNKKEVYIMPYSITFGIVLMLLFFLVIFLSRKTRN